MLIVTVCTANICRSPMAAGLLGHALKAEQEPLRSARIVSAGVAARTGDAISANSRTALKKVGIEFDNHASQPLTRDLVMQADAVLCMTKSHRHVIESAFVEPPKNIHLFREFMPGKVEKEIGDPFGSNLASYEACRDEMVEALPSLLTHLRKLAAKKKSAS